VQGFSLTVRSSFYYLLRRSTLIVRSALLYTGVVGLWMLVAPFPALGQWIADQPNFKALYSVVGRMYNIDADLLEAIAEVESGGDPGSVSPKGALGLMQLMPSTATEFSVLDPFDPVSNILGAADFLESLRQRFAGSLNLQTLPDLLAAYNAGPGAVEKYGWVPPYPETHKYIKRVIERYADALSARPAGSPSLILKPMPEVIQPQPMMMTADSDGSVLDQLAAIRRLRGRFVASMGRRITSLATQPVGRSSN
jgi:hypothetical protein